MLLGRGYNDPIWIKGVLQVDQILARPGALDAVEADLGLGFESVGWDVKINQPLASRKTPPNPREILAFLKKASARYAASAASVTDAAEATEQEFDDAYDDI